MKNKWLNFFLHFVSFNFKLRQRIVESDSLFKVLPFVILFIFSELFLLLISIPLYFVVSPKQVQERGVIFPVKEKGSSEHLGSYVAKRKIGIFAFLGSIGIALFKIVFISALSFYFLGTQTLLAATQSWTFDVPTDYTYDSAKIEVTGGDAGLKGTTVTNSGATTNSGFDSGTTGWTYTDWGQGGGEVNVTGARVTTGGNPGGWVNVSIPLGNGDELGGYWRQGFTTTVDNPTTTVNFNWQVSAFDSTPAPLTFKLYAFVDTGTGVPVVGQEVWSSGEITATSGWASVSNLDVSSKVTTAGTYYLKIAAWIETPASNTGPFTLGFDNVSASWTKSTTTYDATRPTINPTTALNPASVTSWNSFTETATKNGGEIYYQLSDNGGSTWKYWNGSAWAIAGAANYNIASVVNSNISSFVVGAGGVMWKAFLESNGSQHVVLSNVDITYTQNDPPDIQNVNPVQNVSSGYVHVNYNLLDNNSDPASLVNFEYSLTGAFAGEQQSMTAVPGDPSHSGISSLSSSPSGVAHTYVWNAQADLGSIYSNSVYVRLRANDGIVDSSYAASAVSTVDYVVPVVSAVTAAQVVDSSDVLIGYDLVDDTGTDLLVELQISSDGGASWTVTATSVSGDVGGGITTGSGKLITWNSAVDFPNQNVSNMMVRVRAKDKYQNQGSYANSSTFALNNTTPDAPVVDVVADLLAQPLAGTTTVLVGGSFITDIPNTNDFYVAINGGAYGAATPGDTNTATPSNQNVGVGATLNGGDYVSAVKIVHTDDLSQSTANENSAPNVAYKYVKPYTPAAPTVANPGVSSLDVTINKNASEVDGLEYAIFETTQSLYVQGDGSFNASPAWMAAGMVTVNGLSVPLSQYSFKVKSRNISDLSHAASSESDFSSAASTNYQSPNITINSAVQTVDGSKYVVINYTGTDYQNHSNDLVAYDYSLNGTDWQAMTQKGGVGSSGTTGLAFTSSGASFNFAWDVATDLPSTEDSSVYVRLQSTDSTTTSSVAVSAAFVVDTAGPVISNVSASQVADTNSVTISYDLADNAGANNTVEVLISNDSGATYTVPITTLLGDVGAGVTSGTGRSVTWDAGVDFANSESGTMRVKVRATDSFSNQGVFTESADFNADTKVPVVSGVTAAQDSGSSQVVVNYNLSDLSLSTVEFDVSSDGGATWTVVNDTFSGDIGAGQTAGAKSFTWDAATDFPDQELSTMQVRVRALDIFNHQGDYAMSANFSLNTRVLSISNIVAVQNSSSKVVTITYDLSRAADIEVGISSDSGATWVVPTTALSGDTGSGITPGTDKTISWNAEVDFNNQESSTMRVRIRGTDAAHVVSPYYESADFALDTRGPVVSGVTAVQDLGSALVTVNYNLADLNLSTVEFDVSADGGATWTVVNDTYSGDMGAGVAAGAKSFDWNAATDFPDQEVSTMKVRVRAVDSFANQGDYGVSANFSVNTKVLSISNIVAVQNSGVQTVTITYDLNTTADIEVGISSDGGLTWNVPATALSGAVGNDVVAGNGKTIIWDAGVDFNNQESTTMRVRIRGTDAANVVSPYYESANFDLDTLAPSISGITASQTTGSSSVIFHYNLLDFNLSTVGFDVSSDGGATWTVASDTYSGDIGAGQTVGAKSFTWDAGTDFPSSESSLMRVRIRANDIFGNLSGYVESANFNVDTKAPVVSGVTASQVAGSELVTVGYNLADLSSSTVEFDVSSDGGSTWTVVTNTYSGDVGAGQTAGVKSFTWNAGTDFADNENSTMKVRVRANDIFSNQGSFAASADFNVDTKAPVVSGVSASQAAGSALVTVDYTLADLSSSTVEFDVSSDGGATWTVVNDTVSGDVGAGQTAGAKSFTWNAAVDFPDQEASTMKVRVRALDVFGHQGGYAMSANFSVNTRVLSISNIAASQNANSKIVTITYDLNTTADIEVEISSDSGATWVVATTSLSGDVGDGITSGDDKSVTWNAGVDFDNAENSTMRVRIRGTDAANVVSPYYESVDFAVDTKGPVVSGVTASQAAGSALVTIDYTLSDLNLSTVEFDVSSDSGATWVVVNDTVSGDIGAGQAAGVKSFTWNVATDFPDQELSTMQVRVRALDVRGNQGAYGVSTDFSVDTRALVISNIGVTQNSGSDIVTITYDLNKAAEIEVGISSDGGVTWNVAATALSGDVGAGVLPDNGKTISWDASVDFDNQENSSMRVRIRGTDASNVVSSYYESANFVLNTKAAVVEPVVVPVAPSGGGGGPVVLRQERVPLVEPLQAPIILTPKNNDSTVNPIPIFVGIATPATEIEIVLDGEHEFTVVVDGSGGWQFALPTSFALEDGAHTFSLKSVDDSGNLSPSVDFVLNKIEPKPIQVERGEAEISIPEVITPLPSPVTVTPTIPRVPGIVAPVVSTPEVAPVVVPTVPVVPEVEVPIPPVSVVRENITAVEAPGIPVPLVASVTTSQVERDVFTFSGSTLPDQDVAVYLHSTQAIMYRTHSDDEGVWKINHSQDLVALAPGEHTVFAVLVDPVANIKSRPGPMSVFTVKTNFLVAIFNYLNLQTTIVTILVLILAGYWLYRKRKIHDAVYAE